jgi:hypothetical protein
MIRRRNKVRRGLAMLAVVPASLASLAGGLGRAGGRRWMMPLAIFLCLTGLGLLLALGVEALAPFIYAIF